MKDSANLSLASLDPLSSLSKICINEISIRNHSYIISMCIQNFNQTQVDIKVRAKENADQWKSSFDVAAIEAMTAKTGNFKSFNVFVNMLEDAINQRNSSVSIDLFTSDDLELLRQSQQDKEKVSSKHNSSNKRYLILVYNAEYDRIYYPLSLRYCGKPDTVILLGQIRQLTAENGLLKSRLLSDGDRHDLQEQCLRLQKENEDYRERLSSYNEHEKDLKLEYLRHMIQAYESALIQERSNLQKTKTKKNDHYKILNSQIELLKTSERQLKSRVKNLTDEINLLKKGVPSNIPQRSTSAGHPKTTDQLRCRSHIPTRRVLSSSESHGRFNPTVYVHERNQKLKQIELQKKRETRQKLNTGRSRSDSDHSDSSKKSHDNNNNNKRRQLNSKTTTSRQKRANHDQRHKSKDSVDSDIERVSAPAAPHKVSLIKSTKPTPNESSNHGKQNLSPMLHNSTTSDNLLDIDQRLKSLEKFFKQNLLS